MRTSALLTLVILFLCLQLTAQTGTVIINEDGSSLTDPSALLDVQSTSKGVLVPRMSSTQRTAIPSPALGLFVFDTNTQSFWYVGNGAWVEIDPTAPSSIADSDGDTRVEAERTADDDHLRFVVAGTDVLRHSGKALEQLNNGQSVFLGEGAGNSDDLTNNQNVMVGYQAGRLNTVGNSNVFLGYQTGLANTTGNRNTFSGHEAGFSNTGGYFNTFSGYRAGYANTTGYFNTFMGYQAGYNNTTATYNTFIGYRTGHANTTGEYNTFLGFQPGFSNTTGIENTFVGMNAGFNNSTGNQNTFTGYYAGFLNTTGSSNTFSGRGAGYNNEVGSRNVFLGYNAGYNETGSDKLYIDNSSTRPPPPLIWGNFALNRLGVNRVATTNTLEVGGTASNSTGAWNVNSDQRLKKHIKPLDPEATLQKLLQMKGVSYEWDDPHSGYQRPEGTQYGFIAQDIQKVFPDLVSEDAKGWLQTSYGTYDAMYMEAIKALHAQNEVQAEKIAGLEAKLEDLEVLKAAVAELRGRDLGEGRR